MTDFQDSNGRPTKGREREAAPRRGRMSARARMEKDLALLEEIRSLDAKHQNLMDPVERLNFESALNDFRLEDAAFLIREVAGLASTSCDFESFVETGVFANESTPSEGAPVGAVWRFSATHIDDARARLHVVDDAVPKVVVKPRAKLGTRNGRLAAESGSFFATPERPVRLLAAHAHDLVLIVVSGEVRIGREGVKESYVVRAVQGGLGICHLSAGAAFSAPFIIEAVGKQTASAIWAIAYEPALGQSSEQRSPPALISRTSDLPWGVDTASRACSLPVANNNRYAHKAAVHDGYFERHDLQWSSERKEHISRNSETAVRVISSPSQPTLQKGRKTKIELTPHEGLEFILPVSGGFWLWTSSEGHDTPQHGDDAAGVTLSVSSKANERQPYALDLITAGSNSQQFATDVVLLDSSINHTMATLDSVASSCLHVCFAPLAAKSKARLAGPSNTKARLASNVVALSSAPRVRK